MDTPARWNTHGHARRRPAIFAGLTAIAAAVLSLLSACGRGKLPLEIVDPNAAPLAPTVTQVEAILRHRCLSCHHSGGGEAAPVRVGTNSPTPRSPAAIGIEEEDESPDFSSCAGIVSSIEGLQEAVLSEGSMPPGALPRVNEREKLILKRWIEQGACAPCGGHPCP